MNKIEWSDEDPREVLVDCKRVSIVVLTHDRGLYFALVSVKDAWCVIFHKHPAESSDRFSQDKHVSADDAWPAGWKWALVD